jgi:hypothetical protein
MATQLISHYKAPSFLHRVLAIGTQQRYPRLYSFVEDNCNLGVVLDHAEGRESRSWDNTEVGGDGKYLSFGLARQVRKMCTLPTFRKKNHQSKTNDGA